MTRLTNTAKHLSFMFDVRHCGDEADQITDRQRAELGLELLTAARDLFAGIDNKRTAERCRAAISSARGAVRIQDYRESRRQQLADQAAV